MSNPKAPADPVETPSIDARLVRKLADILKDTGLTEIEVERAGLKIRVARELTAAADHLRAIRRRPCRRRSGRRRPGGRRRPCRTAPAKAGER
jgi:acetyl-CoA carboxylase biotin carboxyl carrier protein